MSSVERSGEKAYLRGPGYVLGQAECVYTDLPDLAGQAARLGLSDNPALWGWGRFRVATSGLAELAGAAARASLSAAGLDPAGIDALVLCSTRVPGPAEDHGSFAGQVLTGAGLGDVPYYGQSLNRCVNLLAGVDLALALVRSGRHATVLVVTTDGAAPGTSRLWSYALLSDGAAACVVAADRGNGPAWELLGCASAQDSARLDPAREISADLARAVNAELLTSRGLKLGDIAALAHANIFKPVVLMKERQAGFRREQLYLDNISRVGHCYAADPLINLADRAALGHLGPGRYCLLAASVPGSRIGALLRQAA